VTATTDAIDSVRVVAYPGTGGGRFVLRPTLVEPAPEHASASIQPNDTIAGEALDSPADVDDFTFTGTKGQTINLFLQSLGGPTRRISAYLYNDDAPTSPPGGPPLPPLPVTTVSTTAPTTDLESAASGRWVLTSGGHYRVRILSSSSTTGADVSAVPYRFQVYVIDSLPEHASPQLTPGDTVTESIDHVGDIDSYTISAAPGTLLNVFLEAEPPAPNNITAVVGNPPSPLALARVNGGTKLLDTPSGTFVVPKTGTVTVHIDGPSTGALYRGAYRLFVYQPNLAPETGSAALSLTATPVSGTIDLYGDIDEYTFTVTHPQVIALRVDTVTYAAHPNMMVVNDTTGANVLDSRHVELRSSEILPGAYRLRVGYEVSGQSTYRGPYRFVLASPDTLPEVVPATIGANETISAETSAWPDDIDRFVFTASAPDTIVFSLTRPPNDQWQRSFRVIDLASGATLVGFGADVNQLARIDMPAAARYEVEVEGGDTKWEPGSSAPYSVSAQRVSAAPEHRAASIAIGDTIRDSLDYYGDIDDYTLTGTPGQEINLSGAWPAGFTRASLRMTLTDPATGASLAAIDASPIAVWSATTRIPAGGQIRVRVCAGQNCVLPVCSFSCAGEPHPLIGYWFVVNQIDRAPEKLPATFTLGDSIKGEAVDFPGDVDEFTFAGSANQKISVGFQYYTDGTAGLYGLQLEIVDLTTSAVLTTVTTPVAALDDPNLPTITLPHDGTYLVRIQDQVQLAYEHRNWGPYHFRLAAVP
jgi:hypothetical protein